MQEDLKVQWDQFVEQLLKSGNPHLEKHLTKPLVQHLISLCVIRLVPHQTGARPENWQETGPYLCMEHLILENGAYFKGRKLPRGFKLGTPKYCYSNSYEALRKYQKKNLLYVEGYASSIIPIQHAWNIDSKNEVIELTLRESYGRALDEIDYFGIVFTSDYKKQEILKKEINAVTGGRSDYNPSTIDNWEEGYPLLRESDMIKKVSIPPSSIPVLD